jgi:hypothetical protein
LTALVSDTARPTYDVNRINKTLMVPERISLTEAVDLIKAPREGSPIYPFKRPNKSGKKGTPSKKLKPNPMYDSTAPSTSEGIFFQKKNIKKCFPN